MGLAQRKPEVLSKENFDKNNYRFFKDRNGDSYSVERVNLKTVTGTDLKTGRGYRVDYGFIDCAAVNASDIGIKETNDSKLKVVSTGKTDEPVDIGEVNKENLIANGIQFIQSSRDIYQIERLNPKKIKCKKLSNGEIWHVPYCAVQKCYVSVSQEAPPPVELEFNPQNMRGKTKLWAKIHGKETECKIIRVNASTVTIEFGAYGSGRVPYSLILKAE